MPWLRSRRSLRFIVGDQHNSTSTTRELGFGPRKHGALTGLAQRASQLSGGSLTSNREASPPSPRPRWTVQAEPGKKRQNFSSLRVRSFEKGPSVTPDVFFALFLVLVVIPPPSDLNFQKKTVFCFLNKKTENHKPTQQQKKNTKKFEMLVFICANPRLNRPAP